MRVTMRKTWLPWLILSPSLLFLLLFTWFPLGRSVYDAKNKVPSFNNISMITNSHSAKGFQLVAWNASGTSLSYRIAVTVHVFDAKQ